jgi:adenylate cyclase
VAEVDFEAEGLLDGLEGEAREGRLRLLRELADEGVSLGELREAVAEERLALLPVERVLTGGGKRRTLDEVAAVAGIDRDFLERQFRSLGLAIPADGVAAFTDADVEAAKRLATLRAAGLPDDGILEVGRLLGMTMSQLAAANRTLIAGALMRPGDNEYDVAKRFASAAETFAPLAGETLNYLLNLHLREQIRHDAIGSAELTEGTLGSAQEATVAFADIAGFTRLGEKLPPDELGEVSGRMFELASEVIELPVRLVKLIGDAAMIVGPEPSPVVEATLRLVESTEDADLPPLRGGVAAGMALQRAGDWYGHPVNLASRITGIARPASVLASEPVREAASEDFQWSFAGSRRLKGIRGGVRLYRARRSRE